MKVSISILIASAVVLASSIYAQPTLLKRVAQAADAVACLSVILLNPLQSSPTALSECQSKLTQDVGLVKGATVKKLQFDLRGDIPTIATTDINVLLKSFTGLPSIPVSGAKLDMAIMDGPTNTGSFASVWLTTTPIGFSLNMTLPVTSLTITDAQRPAFVAFLSALTKSTSHDIVLAGTTSVNLTFSVANALNAIPNPFGIKVPAVPAVGTKVVPLNGLAITAPITLKGFNNFGGVIQGHLDSVSATDKSTIQGTVMVNNPSDISVAFGDIDFQLWSKDATPEYLGIATVENLNLVPGSNTYTALFKVDAAAQIGKYFPVKAGLTLSVNGFAGSSKNLIAAGVVASVKFDLVF